MRLYYPVVTFLGVIIKAHRDIVFTEFYSVKAYDYVTSKYPSIIAKFLKFKLIEYTLGE